MSDPWRVETRHTEATISEDRKIAIIAVHGVADQQPGDSLRAVGKLLGEHGGITSQTHHALYLQEPAIRQEPGIPYETSQLRGKTAAAQVDTFEVYWADLSRVGIGILGLLQALFWLPYNLIQTGIEHLRRADLLDTKVVDESKGAAPPQTTSYRKFLAWHARFMRALLFGGPPVLEMLKLATLPLLIPAAVLESKGGEPPSWLVPLLVLTYLLAVVFGISKLLKAGPTNALILIPVPVTLIAVWLCVPYSGLQVWTALLGLVICSILLMALKHFDFGGPLCLVWICYVAGLCYVVCGTSVTEVKVRATQVVESLGILLYLTWCLVLLMIILGWLSRVHFFVDSKREKIPNGSVAWPLRVGQTLATTILLVALTASWAIASNIATQGGVFPSEDSYSHRSVHESVSWHLYKQSSGRVKLPGKGPFEYINDKDETKHSRFTPDSSTVLVVSLLASGALVFLLLLLAPSLYCELRHPEAGDSRYSKSLGDWLDESLIWVRVLPDCFLLLVFVSVGGIMANTTVAEALRTQSYSLFLLVSGSAVGIAGLTALAGQLKAISSSLRPILDIVLDVLNYLVPKGSKETMVARYKLLLSHLGRENYSVIIIAAHSLGSVLTLDVLSEVESKQSLDLDAKYLVTYGSPLRQLIGRFLPAYYESEICGHPAEGTFNPHPKTDWLGVKRWTNFYRSGDYVGREIWRIDDSRFDPDGLEYTELSAGRREVCLGPGAHTHYWTESEIGQEIVRFIKLESHGEGSQ